MRTPSVSWVALLVVGLLIGLAGCGDGPVSDLDRYRAQFDYANSELEVKKQETVRAIRAIAEMQTAQAVGPLPNEQEERIGVIDRGEPLPDRLLIFTNQREAEEYLRLWRQATRVSDELSVQFGRVNEVANNYFVYLRNRAVQNIQDQQLEQEMVSYIDRNRLIFNERFTEANTQLVDLQDQIQQGNDIAEAIRIAGSVKVLGTLESDVEPVDVEELLNRIQLVSELIYDGAQVLEQELDSDISRES